MAKNQEGDCLVMDGGPLARCHYTDRLTKRHETHFKLSWPQQNMKKPYNLILDR